MRCPVCKADNNQAPQCRRCKADLTLLVALERLRVRVVAEARSCLSQSEAVRALDRAEEVDWLRSDEESRRLLALAQLLAGDFAEAWASYAAARKGR